MTEVVFREICKLSQNWYDSTVFSSKTIAKCTRLPRRAVLKALHKLRDEGLIVRGSQGCPAVVSRGEIEELECEAMPPVNGWTVTGKGMETEEWERAEQEYEEGLRKWAEAKDEEEEQAIDWAESYKEDS